jgi:hypothetical protein
METIEDILADPQKYTPERFFALRELIYFAPRHYSSWPPAVQGAALRLLGCWLEEQRRRAGE